MIEREITPLTLFDTKPTDIYGKLCVSEYTHSFIIKAASIRNECGFFGTASVSMRSLLFRVDFIRLAGEVDARMRNVRVTEDVV